MDGKIVLHCVIVALDHDSTCSHIHIAFHGPEMANAIRCVREALGIIIKAE